VRWWCHILSTLSLAAALLPDAACAAMAAAGSVAPDWLERTLRLPHRSAQLHNVLTGAALLFAPAALGALPAAAFGLGYLHHVLLDALTKGGVRAGRGRLRGPLNSMNEAHNLLVLLPHLLLAALVR